MKLFTPHIWVPRGRARTCDVAFTYRMGAGFAGDVNRTHPASIEPCLIDASAPPTVYGNAVLVDATTQGVRPLTTTDQALTEVYGVLVRPYPLQQSTTANAYGAIALGAATPPASGVVDVLKSGYIMANVVGTPVKGAQAYVWTAATSGVHLSGGWEAVNPTSSGMAPTRVYFNGGADANGITEIAFKD